MNKYWFTALALAAAIVVQGQETQASTIRRRLGEDELSRRQLGDEEFFCPRGYKNIGGYCVLSSCHFDYSCPLNAHRLIGRDCYDNFDDCECDHLYYKQGYECVKYEQDTDDHPPEDDHVECDSDYECPSPNYKGKDHLDCFHGLDDCECSKGYKMLGGCCVEWKCKHDYKCPSNSYRRPLRKCYNDITDCACVTGYVKFRSKCIRDKTH